MRISKAPKFYRDRIRKLRKTSPGKKSLTYAIGHRRENRGYREYNFLFRKALGGSIIEALIALGRKSLEIIDDGAGDGRFLKEIKKKLSKAGIKSRTIALSLGGNENLALKRKLNHIDELKLGSAEDFLPEKPADAIFSFLGSISYVEDLVRKEHLLKFAHSLKKGGIMMVGFELQTERRESKHGIIARGLSRNPKQYQEIESETEMKGIEKAFYKQGFDAKFSRSNILTQQGYPNWVIIVRRVK